MENGGLCNPVPSGSTSYCVNRGVVRAMSSPSYRVDVQFNEIVEIVQRTDKDRQAEWFGLVSGFLWGPWNGIIIV